MRTSSSIAPSPDRWSRCGQPPDRRRAHSLGPVRRAALLRPLRSDAHRHRDRSADDPGSSPERCPLSPWRFSCRASSHPLRQVQPPRAARTRACSLAFPAARALPPRRSCAAPAPERSRADAHRDRSIGDSRHRTRSAPNRASRAHRTYGNADEPHAKTATSDDRSAPSSCPRSSAKSARDWSDRWRWPAESLRSDRPAACPCDPGTVARKARTFRRSVADLPHRACRRRARIFPSPTHRSRRSTRAWATPRRDS